MIDITKKYRMRHVDSEVLLRLEVWSRGEYPIIATFEGKRSGSSFVRTYTRKGYYHANEMESPYDLIEIKEEKMLVNVTGEIIEMIAKSIDKRLAALSKANRASYIHPGTTNLETLIKLKLGLGVSDSDRAHLEKYFPEKHSIDVKLNSEWTAVVHKDKIVVGCQEFPVSKLKELLEAHSSI